MIQLTATQLWTLVGIWLAVFVVVFALGWNAALRWHLRPEPPPPAVIRRPPAGHALPRSGRLELADNPTAIDFRRHWPQVERETTPDTLTFSHVEVSNWEAKIRREQAAWEHLNGLDEVWMRDVQ